MADQFQIVISGSAAAARMSLFYFFLELARLFFFLLFVSFNLANYYTQSILHKVYLGVTSWTYIPQLHMHIMDSCTDHKLAM